MVKLGSLDWTSCCCYHFAEDGGAFAYNSGLSSCVRAGVWKQGLQLCRAMHRWKIEMQIVAPLHSEACLPSLSEWRRVLFGFTTAMTCALFVRGYQKCSSNTVSRDW